MAVLPNAKIELETDYPVEGFSFKILGPQVNGDYLPRDQGANNVFTTDYAGNPFQSGIMYLLTAEHPVYMLDPELSRVIFDENGNSVAVTSTEVRPGDLHATCLIGSVTTKQITTDGYLRPKKSFVADYINGLAVWQDAGNNLERLERLPIEILRELLKETTTYDTYALGVRSNTCTNLVFSLVNQTKKTLTSSAKIYINDEYYSDIITSVANADIAAQFGLPANALVICNFAVPATFQNNLIHTISIRHIVSGAQIWAVQTPGNCGIQTAPVPTFKRRKHLEEKPVTTQPPTDPDPQPTNPPPIVFNPLGGTNDIVVEGIGTMFMRFPADEFYDTEQLTYRGFNYNGSNEIPLPPGITYDATFGSSYIGQFVIDGSVPDGTTFVMRREARDSAPQNPPAAYNKLVTIRRTSDPVNPLPYVVRREIFGGDELVEGVTRNQYYVKEWLNTGINRTQKGPGKPYWKTPYPDGLACDDYDGQSGFWTSKIPENTITDDFDMTLCFDYLDGSGITVTKTVRAINVNNQANRSPVLVTPIQFLFANMSQAFSYEMMYNNHFTDPDGDQLTGSLQISNDGGNTFTSVLPAWLTVNGNNYGGTHPAFNGTQIIYRLRIIASDGKGGTANDDFNLIVNNPTPPAEITKVGVKFNKSNTPQGYFSDLDTYLVTTGNELEMATWSAEAGKSNYNKMNVGSYAQGYNRLLGYYGVYSGQKLKIYFREVGKTNDILVLDYTCPNVSTALTQIYPV